MNFGQLALRGVVGPLFVGHGAQKLFGWFDGHGIEGTGGFFEQLGLRPGKRHATAAGIAETAGGALITAGALTPVATSALTGTMLTAIRKAHVSNGPWVTQGGWEYNAVLVAALTALADSGPGRPSVDAARFPRFHGAGFALMSLAAGALGSYLATERFATSGGAQEGAFEEAGDPATTDSPSPAEDGAHADDGRFTGATTPVATTEATTTQGI
jgi:putative oxidoreductase